MLLIDNSCSKFKKVFVIDMLYSASVSLNIKNLPSRINHNATIYILSSKCCDKIDPHTEGTGLQVHLVVKW